MERFQNYVRMAALMLLTVLAGENKVSADTMLPTLDVDKTTVPVGQSFTINTMMGPVPGWCELTYYCSKTDSTKDTRIGTNCIWSVGADSFDYTINKIGTYYVVADIILYEVCFKVTTNYVKVDVVAPQVSLSADVDEVDAGQDITLTATTDYDSPKYSYYVSKDGGESYNLIASNQSSATISYNSLQAGTYMFKVGYTTSGYHFESDPVTVTVKAVEPYLTASVSSTKVLPYDPVEVKAAAVCFTPETYTYSYSKDGSDYMDIEMTSNNSCIMCPEETGTYTFKVKAGGKEATTSSVSVVDCKMAVSTPSTSVNADEDIYIVSYPENFTPTSATYYYKRDDGDWNVISTVDYEGTSGNITYAATQAGTYHFRVSGTDGTHTATSGEIMVEVAAVTPKLNVAISSDNAYTGDEVTLTATPICCLPESYTYSYSKDGSDYTEIETTADSICTFTPTAAGKYSFKVTSGTMSVAKSFTAKDCIATLTAQETWVEAMDTIHLSASVENFTPTTLTYSYKIGDGDWKKLATLDYSEAALTPEFIMSQYGVHYFKVEASDGTHTATSDEVRVEVSEVTHDVLLATSATDILLEDAITLMAIPVCCTPVTYDYYYTDNPSGTHYELIERSTEPTCKFVPAKVGTYKLNVEVTNDDGSVYDAYTDIITVTARPTQTLTTNANGVLSCTATYPLDFSSVEGLKAYVATGVTSSAITLKRVYNVQKGEAFIVSGANSTDYAVPSTKSVTHDDDYVNLFKSANGTKTAVDYAPYVYCLNTSGNFQRVDDAVVIPSGKAYLTTSAAGAKVLWLDYEEEDTPTAVGHVESESVNGKWLNDTWYNLAGQRVGKDAKGIIIVNGQKYLRK